MGGVLQRQPGYRVRPTSRSERPSRKPYNVRYWEVGNELWGNWQIGHCSKEEYAKEVRRLL